LEQADEEARLDGSAEVTTLHLLLGLQREGVAANALRSLEISDDRLRPAVRARLGAPGAVSDKPPPRSGELTCAIEAAADMTRRRSFGRSEAHEVGTEQVLFVLGVDRGSPTQLVLDDLGVTIPDVKRALEQTLNPVDAPRLRRRRRGRNCNRVCSFCVRAESAGTAVVAGPGVAICDSCVELARRSLAQRQAR
jgi:hypothetical protein